MILTLSRHIFKSIIYIYIFFFSLKQGSTHEGTTHCPGEFCWQNQTVLNAGLLGAKIIGKYDHPICRQPSNGDDRAVGS